MGQAKQRAKKFGQPVRQPMVYRDAVCYAVYDGSERSAMLVSMELAFLRYPGTVYRPVPDRTAPSDLAPLLQGYSVPEGTLALIDPASGRLVEIVDVQEAERRLESVIGFHTLTCEVSGPAHEVGLAGRGELVAASLGTVDAFEFLKGKARMLRTGVMPSDFPFSAQLVGIVVESMALDAPLPDPLMDHVLHQFQAFKPLLAKMPVAVHADAGVMARIERGEPVFDEDGFADETDGHPVLAMLHELGELEAQYELPDVLKAYCANEQEGFWIVKARHLDQNRIWEDFESEAFQLSMRLGQEILIGEEAWRGSCEIGGAIAAGHRDIVDRFYRFFDRGILVGHADLVDGTRFDVIDIQDMRFIIKTVPDDLAELVAWKTDGAAIDAATPDIEGQEASDWIAHRFVPSDMSRPDLMRIEMAREIRMSPTAIRQFVSNLHGFDSWRLLEQACATGPHDAPDEDTPAAQVDKRHRMAADRAVAKCGLAPEFVFDMITALRPFSAKGKPSLEGHEPPMRVFPDLADSNPDDIRAAAMEMLGYEGDAGEFEDRMRSAAPVHPSAWIALLQEFGWKPEDVDLSDEGQSVGPGFIRFGSVTSGHTTFDLSLVPFASSPTDNGDELLEDIMAEIEDNGVPTLLFQNKVQFGVLKDLGVLYGGSAWDGGEWWHFCLRPGHGVEDVITQKGKDAELLAKRFVTSYGFEGVRERASRLQMALMGETGDVEVSFMENSGGWIMPVVIGEEAAGLLAALKASR